MSSELQWLLLKNFNSFQVKRRQTGTKTLTSEPFNLTAIHSQKYSGLANQKSIGITAAADKGVVLAVHSDNSHKTFKPKASATRVTLKKSFRQTARSVRKSVNRYRPDLKKAALAKANLLAKAQKRAAAPKKAAAAKTQ
eukprot:TRINITY_DN2298_c0_g1_i1.p1 TRINITY_DN2298_c0_g1~~TRINITY_DN2298_c0_g1_i1.p1  ORF type:complete len:139 (-),score=72.44 TRINITY_DN2298_c0_g1_i1:55-471(-)